MIPIIGGLIQRYQEAKPYADPRTKHWFLLEEDPTKIWALTALYLLVVFFGPSIMKNREAFQLRTFMVVYNLGLVALSLYMFIEIYLSTSAAGYGWLCAPYNQETIKDPLEQRIADVLWWYFFSKAIELMDTVLMILRKKNDQVTFLHYFHHASMLNIWWWVMMFIPGGQSWFGSSLNCLVHVVMYSYYGLSAIPSLKEKLWWKRHITNFQLIQFCITLTHTIQTYTSGCDFPIWGVYLLGGYMIFMLILFSNFYLHAYIMKKRSKQMKMAGQQNGGSYIQNGVQNGTNHMRIDKISNGHLVTNAQNGTLTKRH